MNNYQPFQIKKAPQVSKSKLDKNSLLIEEFIQKISTLHQIYICPIEKKIYFNKKTLFLQKQPKVFMIFYSLYKNKDEGLDREELIEKIYDCYKGDLSERQKNTLKHNIVKLISRARKIANEEFGNSSIPIEWFSYHPQSKKWVLFKPDIALPNLL